MDIVDDIDIEEHNKELLRKYLSSWKPLINEPESMDVYLMIPRFKWVPPWLRKFRGKLFFLNHILYKIKKLGNCYPI